LLTNYAFCKEKSEIAMDKTTLFGIIAGTSLIMAAIMLGGAIDTFINVPGFMIVVGGTLAAISVNYPLNEIVQAHTAAYKIFVTRKGSRDRCRQHHGQNRGYQSP
jgi:flagellar motor component MotA